ncbi:MAG: alkaline phosphatase family protein [Bacteroidetes bacterium]|nr:alkaline phosphatase family protein [Bacteroidota bacterium]
MSILFLTTVYCQQARHIVLISIDGFRPEFYLDSCWPSPNMQLLIKQGVHAKQMKSVFPSYTYPSHVAMLTGALPARSGIYYNIKNSAGEWNWYAKDIKTPTIWQALHKSGMTSAVIEWPVSVGAEVDYAIPEIWDPKNPSDRISEVRKYATPGLIEEIEKNATGKLDSNSMNEEFLSLDENAGRMAAYIFKTYKPNLICLHFACVDGAQHEVGREGMKVKQAVASADRSIGNMLEAIERSGLKDSTTVIIVGDHGFMTIDSFIRPNIWLKKNGILIDRDHWKAKFTAAGGSAFLYLQNKKDEATLHAVREILNQLAPAQKKLFRVIEKNELDKMGVDSSAVLALASSTGVVFSGGDNGDIMGKASGGHHGFDPNMPEMMTGFIAAGPDINKNTSIDRLCVTDISLLIAKLLGIDFKTPDGKMIPGILSEPGF